MQDAATCVLWHRKLSLDLAVKSWYDCKRTSRVFAWRVGSGGERAEIRGSWILHLDGDTVPLKRAHPYFVSTKRSLFFAKAGPLSRSCTQAALLTSPVVQLECGSSFRSTRWSSVVVWIAAWLCYWEGPACSRHPQEVSCRFPVVWSSCCNSGAESLRSK